VNYRAALPGQYWSPQFPLNPPPRKRNTNTTRVLHVRPPSSRILPACLGSRSPMNPRQVVKGRMDDSNSQRLLLAAAHEINPPPSAWNRLSADSQARLPTVSAPNALAQCAVARKYQVRVVRPQAKSKGSSPLIRRIRKGFPQDPCAMCCLPERIRRKHVNKESHAGYRFFWSPIATDNMVGVMQGPWCRPKKKKKKRENNNTVRIKRGKVRLIGHMNAVDRQSF